jgi:hypothetical protein
VPKPGKAQLDCAGSAMEANEAVLLLQVGEFI